MNFSCKPAVPYTFGYRVTNAENTLQFGQIESSDGHVVAGTYRVTLPDGRIQTVKYTADDDNGYVATVTYEHAPVSYLTSVPHRRINRP